MVAHNPRVGIDLVEDTQHFVEGLHLLGGAVVLVLDVCRKTSAAFIADSDAVRIEALHMATSFCNGTAIVQGSVATDIDMIARVLSETARPMPGHEFLDGEVLVGTRVRAVEHQQTNLPRRMTTVPLQRV